MKFSDFLNYLNFYLFTKSHDPNTFWSNKTEIFI